jgi:hypothetical protein
MISSIRKNFTILSKESDTKGFQEAWQSLFQTLVSQKSLETFQPYFREMVKRKTYRAQGGALAYAPLNYSMGPGANVEVYGRFPTEVATDPQSLQDLDVFYRSGLSRGCGSEDISLQVPVDMGSNLVKSGGRRKTQRRLRGGSFLGSMSDSLGKAGTNLSDIGNTLVTRPFVSTAPVNQIQGSAQAWYGNPDTVPVPSQPTYQNWKYMNEIQQQPMNPVTYLTRMPPANTPGIWNITGPTPASGGRRKTQRRKTQRRKTSKRK